MAFHILGEKVNAGVGKLDWYGSFKTEFAKGYSNPVCGFLNIFLDHEMMLIYLSSDYRQLQHQWTISYLFIPKEKIVAGRYLKSTFGCRYRRTPTIFYLAFSVPNILCSDFTRTVSSRIGDVILKLVDIFFLTTSFYYYFFEISFCFENLFSEILFGFNFEQPVR